MIVKILKRSMSMHNPWFIHPENPMRVKIILDALKQSKLREILKEVVVDDIDEKIIHDILRRIHCESYIRYVEKLAAKAPAEIDPDTYIAKDTLPLAIEAVYVSYTTGLTDESTFIILRPPGHHAGRCGKAMGAPTQGFCIFNNTATLILGLIDRGYKRIVVLDFDIHHGNGTQEIFYRDNTVLHIDIHRDPRDFYPFTGFPDQIGNGKGRGYSVNLLLPPNAGDDLYLKILDKVIQLINEYNADAVVLSAGFDGYYDDGLADTRLTANTYHAIGSLIHRLKTPHYTVLEGGYSSGLTYGLPAYVQGLMGLEPEYREEITHTSKNLRDYYSMLNISTINKIKKYW